MANIFYQWKVKILSGVGQGMKLLLNLHPDEYTPEVVTNNYLEAGAILLIDYDPYGFFPTNPIGIKPASRAWISLKGKRKVTTPPTYQVFERECENNLTLEIMKGKCFEVSTAIS